MDLVFLHGPAAAGKLTTARALSARLGWPVFHNHLVVDLLTVVFPFGSEPFVRLREQFWLRVFESAAEDDRSLIFTFAPEPSVLPGFSARARGAVETRSGSVRFVHLTVSDSEQERRIGNADRSEFGKLVDVETLHRIRQDGIPVEPPPGDLVIDTERSTPDESAQVIIDRFRLRPEPAVDRYPVRPDP